MIFGNEELASKNIDLKFLFDYLLVSKLNQRLYLSALAKHSNFTISAHLLKCALDCVSITSIARLQVPSVPSGSPSSTALTSDNMSKIKHIVQLVYGMPVQ